VPGKLIHWFDIPVLDIERAGNFYSTILGVELTHLEAPPDVVMKWFPSDDPQSGGGLLQGGGVRPSSEGTVVYFNGGDDLDTVLNRVEAAGGRVLTAKTGDEKSGYVAFFMDTEGNRVGLNTAGSTTRARDQAEGR
jgi:predicted enzyme related to lactoylglutathione lyase